MKCEKKSDWISVLWVYVQRLMAIFKRMNLLPLQSSLKTNNASTYTHERKHKHKTVEKIIICAIYWFEHAKNISRKWKQINMYMYMYIKEQTALQWWSEHVERG